MTRQSRCNIKRQAFCRSCYRQKCQRFIFAKILQKNQNRESTQLGIGFHFPFGVSRVRPCDALETNDSARNVAKRLRLTTAARAEKRSRNCKKSVAWHISELEQVLSSTNSKKLLNPFSHWRDSYAAFDRLRGALRNQLAFFLFSISLTVEADCKWMENWVEAVL